MSFMPVAALLQNINFWVLIAFIGFVISAFRPIKRPFLALLDAYAAQIKEELQQAHQMQQEAENLLHRTKEKHHKTVIQIEEIFELVQKEVLHLQEKAAEEKALYLTLKDQLLSRRIEHNLQKAQQEVRSYLIHQAFTEVRTSLEKTPQQGAFDSSYLFKTL